MNQSAITQRINNAKKYPHLDQMHPVDREDYLAGKYRKKDKVRFLCPVCGEYYMQSPRERQKGHGHMSCTHKQRGIDQRLGEDYHSFDDLTPEFQEKCRNKEITMKDRVDFVCPVCGDIYSTLLGSHEKGGYCGSCASKLRRSSCQARTDYDFIDDIHPDDRHLIEQGKVNNKSEVRIKCSECGEYFAQVIASRTNGFTRCKACGMASTSVARRRRKYNFINPLREDYAEALKNGELTYSSRVIFVCPTHGEYEQKLSAGQKHGCQTCALTETPYSFYRFLLTLTDNIIVNDRQQIAPKEIDFYLPDYKIGFEFNDINTHQTLFPEQETNNRNYGGKSTKYHYKKWQTAKKKEITLMHVWDVDWQDDDRKEKIKDIVVSLLSGHPIEEANHNTLMFYEYKTRSVIEHKPDDYDALREKCISGKAARYFTCGISI